MLMDAMNFHHERLLPALPLKGEEEEIRQPRILDVTCRTRLTTRTNALHSLRT